MKDFTKGLAKLAAKGTTQYLGTATQTVNPALLNTIAAHNVLPTIGKQSFYSTLSRSRITGTNSGIFTAGTAPLLSYTILNAQTRNFASSVGDRENKAQILKGLATKLDTLLETLRDHISADLFINLNKANNLILAGNLYAMTDEQATNYINLICQNARNVISAAKQEGFGSDPKVRYADFIADIPKEKMDLIKRLEAQIMSHKIIYEKYQDPIKDKLGAEAYDRTVYLIKRQEKEIFYGEYFRATEQNLKGFLSVYQIILATLEKKAVPIDRRYVTQELARIVQENPDLSIEPKSSYSILCGTNVTAETKAQPNQTNNYSGNDENQNKKIQNFASDPNFRKASLIFAVVTPAVIKNNNHIVTQAIIDGNLNLVKQLVTMSSFDPGHCDDQGRNLVMCAIANQQSEILETLINAGVNPHAKDIYGRGAYCYLAGQPLSDKVESIIYRLTDMHGVNPEQQNILGQKLEEQIENILYDNIMQNLKTMPTERRAAILENKPEQEFQAKRTQEAQLESPGRGR